MNRTQKELQFTQLPRGQEGELLVHEMDLGGFVKEDLIFDDNQKEEIELILKETKNIKKLKKFNLPVTSKLLLYGPPGTGKTMTAQYIATSLGRRLLIVNLSTIVNSSLGRTSKNIDKVFAQARNMGCLLFIDELDTISLSRGYEKDVGEMKRVLTSLLQIFDLLDENSFVLSATNRIEDIDPALVRRFDKLIEYKLPSMQQVEYYVSSLLSKHNFELDAGVKEQVVNFFLNKSYSDIKRHTHFTLKRIVLSRKAPGKKVVIKKSDMKYFTI